MAEFVWVRDFGALGESAVDLHSCRRFELRPSGWSTGPPMTFYATPDGRWVCRMNGILEGKTGEDNLDVDMFFFVDALTAAFNIHMIHGELPPELDAFSAEVGSGTTPGLVEISMVDAEETRSGKTLTDEEYRELERRLNSLTPCQSDCVLTLYESDRRLSTEELLQAMEAAGRIHGLSTVKTALAMLTHPSMRILENRRDTTPRGYGFFYWD